MAQNRVYESGTSLSLPVASGTDSGEPVAVGSIPGVAVTDRNAAGESTVDMDGVYDLAVKGVDASGNAAVAVGAILYLQSNGDINIKSTTGIRFGYALAAVSSGATTVIRVKVGY